MESVGVSLCVGRRERAGEVVVYEGLALNIKIKAPLFKDFPDREFLLYFRQALLQG